MFEILHTVLLEMFQNFNMNVKDFKVHIVTICVPPKYILTHLL